MTIQHLSAKLRRLEKLWARHGPRGELPLLTRLRQEPTELMRAAGLTQDRRRTQARAALKERKADEAYQEWLRLLRDRTYVELRLEDR